MGAVPPLIILMHAPVLGPASWRPVAGELSGAGLAAVVPSLAGFAAGGPPYARRLVATAAGQVLAGAARPAADEPAAHEPAADESAANDAAANDAAVLVTHSGAGVFAAQLSAAIGARDVTAIFADAALPGQSGAGPVVDSEFLPYLREIASDGLVPPWPQWWPGEDLSPLFPDEQVRGAVTSEAELTRPAWRTDAAGPAGLDATRRLPSPAPVTTCSDRSGTPRRGSSRTRPPGRGRQQPPDRPEPQPGLTRRTPD